MKNISYLKRCMFILLSILFLGLIGYEMTGIRTISTETVNWGMFIKRCMVILLVYAFLALHCFIDIKILYESIYKYRVFIALGLFVFMVLNKFHFSSVNQYDSYIQPGQGSQYAETVFGESRAIRSDEWLVNLPRFMAADYENYGSTNDIVRATETNGMSATGLYRSYSAIARPADWGFYMFGSEYGLSYSWCFKIIFGFLFAFELCTIISRGNRKLGLLGGILIEFSAFNMWWSTVDWLLAGNAAIVCFYYFLRQRIVWKQALCGIGTAIFASFYIINIYPAWQVPAGFIYLALLIWVFVDNKDSWKQYSWKNWVTTAVSIIFMASLVVVYLYNYMDYMQAIMKTVYPGSRVTYGGYALSKMTGYLMSALTSFISYSNPSELSCFYGVFPFAMIIFIIVLVKKRGKNLLMWLILVPVILLTAYCTVELPPIIAKITMLTYSMPERAADALGFANVLMLIIAVSEQKEEEKLPIPIGVLIAVISTGYAVYLPISTEELGKKTLLGILVLAFITVVAQVALVCRIRMEHRVVAAGMMGGVVLLSGIRVNPLMCGLDAIKSKPLAQEIQSIVEEDKDAKWFGLDSLINGNYLIACGARTYNSTNYIPNMEFWKKLDPNGEYDEVYNRYAHIVVTLTEKETEMKLVQQDYIQLDLSYEDLLKLDVDYVLSIYGTLSTDYMELIYGENGMYIYHILDK